MLSFGNKEFRNLQEQVLKNMRDIQDIEQGATILADFGIKVVGQVESVEDLPDPTTYEGEYGDAYLVGTEKPYNYYIFTRAFEGQEEPSWFDLGEFPVAGPQGATGPQGEVGATPVIGATVGSVSTLNPGQAATASVSVSGTAAQPTMIFNFAIPQGAQGIQGATGPQGPQGPRGLQGEKGEKGEQGGLIDIVGIVATADLLPAPSTLQKLDAAYLVGSSPDYELYVQVGETPSTALWTNLGAVNEGTVVSVNGTPQTVWEANTKVSVSDGYLMNTLYGQAAGTGNGQTHVPYGTAATANYIPQRDSNGQILVPETPTANNMAASKAYVDANAGGQSPIQYAGDLIVGDSSGEESRLAIGSAGQVLTVNSNGNGLEYTNIEGVPSYTNTDAEKALKVNSAGTGLEWGNAGGGISEIANPNNANYPLGYVIGKTLTCTNGESTDSRAYNNNALFLVPDEQTRTEITLAKCGSGTTISGLFSSNVAAIKGSLMLPGSLPHNAGDLTPSAENSIVGSRTSGTKTAVLSNSMALTTSTGLNTGAPGLVLKNSILIGNNVDSNGSYAPILDGCIFMNTPSYTKHNLGTSGNYSRYYTGILCTGTGHSLGISDAQANTDARLGLAIVGKYGIYADSNITDKFIVGVGTSSTRANCFATGNDGTNDYIKIGDTKITEAQLQALLALLNT